MTSRLTARSLALVLLMTTIAELMALGLFVAETGNPFVDRPCVRGCAAIPERAGKTNGVRTVTRMGDRPRGHTTGR